LASRTAGVAAMRDFPVRLQAARTRRIIIDKKEPGKSLGEKKCPGMEQNVPCHYFEQFLIDYSDKN
jgi:hypothetical protein